MTNLLKKFKITPLFIFEMTIAIVISALGILTASVIFQPQNPSTSFPPETALIFLGMFILPLVFLINNIKILSYNWNLFKVNLKQTLILPSVAIILFSFVISLMVTSSMQNFGLAKALTAEFMTVLLLTATFTGAIGSTYLVIKTLVHNITAKNKIRPYLYAVPIFGIAFVVGLMTASSFEGGSAMYWFLVISTATLLISWPALVIWENLDQLEKTSNEISDEKTEI